MISPRRLLTAAVLVGVAISFGVTRLADAQESGWRVTSFHSNVTIDADGDVHFLEAIDVDFGSIERHGINRDIVTRQACGDVNTGPEPVYRCPGGSDRLYPITVEGVSDASGNAVPYVVSSEGGATRVRIGDPDRLVSGPQSYRLQYRLRAALNAFDGHDELYWNITGNRWTVPLESVTATVTLPDGAETFVACYQGFASSAGCDASADGSTATFAATRTLFPNEELTAVVGWQKGIVAVQPPVLEDRVSVDDFFTFDWIEWAGMAAVALLGFVAIGRAWWLFGRDRRYRTLFYLTEDPSERTAPLLSRMDIVVEYLPPDDLKPAQMGVIVDERADTLDVTATIIDFAVRGYLKITELDKQGWFAKTDWRLDKLRDPGDELLPYEDRLFKALFRGRESVQVSALKTKFYEDLAEVKSDLYGDAVGRRWFARNPETVRRWWLVAAVAVTVTGALLSVASGFLFERALIPVPLILAGIVLMVFSRAMARRTATGSEAYRRVLGFKRYIATAETRRQEFNEQANIFARYLPYAIVFECVDKWADAFEGMDEQVREATGYWYAGTVPFQVGAFTAGMGSFSSSMSTAISSTPGGSGGSGFSGGFSGGGGGGGGGSSW